MADDLISYAIKANDDLSPALADISGAAKETQVELDGLSNTAGDVESRMRGLAGAVALVSPELAALMNIAAELAGGLEAAGKSAGMLGSKLGMVGAAVGVAAVAVAAAGTAWIVYTNSQEKAHEGALRQEAALSEIEVAAGRLAAELGKVKAAWDAFQGQQSDVADQIAVINGLMTETEAAAKKQAAAIEAAARPAIVAGGQRVALLQAEIAARKELERLAGTGDREAQKAVAATTTSIRSLEGDLRTAQAALDAKKAEVAQTIANVTAIAEYKDASKAATVAEKEKTRAVKETTKALEVTVGPSMAFAGQVEALGALMDRLASSGLDLDKAQRDTGLSFADLSAALVGVSKDDLPAVAEAIGAFADAAGAAGQKLAAGAEAPPPLSTGGEANTGIGVATDILGAVSGGFAGVTSFIASLGPVGALVAAALSLLSGGAGGLFDTLDSINDAIVNIIGAIPEVVAGIGKYFQIVGVELLEMLPDLIGGIIEALPSLLTDLATVMLVNLPAAMILVIPRLVAALILAIPTMLRGLVVELPRAIVAEMRTLPRLFADAFRDMLREQVSVWDRNREGNSRAAGTLNDTARRGRGGSTVNFNGLGFGDDRAVMQKIANLLKTGRLGVSFG